MDIRKRNLIYKQVNRDRDKMAKKFKPLWLKALSKQVESYNHATGEIDEKPIKDAMLKNWVSVGTLFAVAEARRIIGQKALGDPDTPDPNKIDLLMIAKVNNEFAEKITNITETTLKEIARLIQVQLDAGLNPRDIVPFITSEMERINESRALTIARTESIGASNAGAYEGAKSLGIPLKKTWSASFINTRDWHESTNGQVRPFDSPYTVNGEQMQHPLDATLGASADNIINCRCVSINEPI